MKTTPKIKVGCEVKTGAECSDWHRYFQTPFAQHIIRCRHVIHGDTVRVLTVALA